MTRSNQHLQKPKLGHRKILHVTGARREISRARDVREETARHKGNNIFVKYHTMVHVCAFKRYFHLTFAKKYGTVMTLKLLINETFPETEQSRSSRAESNERLGSLRALPPRQPTYTTYDPSTENFKNYPPRALSKTP